MKNKVFKTSLVAAAALAVSMVAVACDGAEETENPPEVTTYAVTYSLNGGNGAVPTQDPKAEGATFTIASGDGIYKTGYTFDGWSDGTTKYNAGDTYTMPGHEVTFTAQWETIASGVTTYTVTYELNGGLGTAPTQAPLEANATFNLSTGTGLNKPGFHLTGWDYNTTFYSKGGSFTMPANNVTLVAHWEPDGNQGGGEGGGEEEGDTYTVTYKHGAATNDEGEAIGNVVVENQNAGSYAVAAPSAYLYEDEEHNSFCFAGWKVENAEGDTVYLPGQTLTLSANTSLVAQWVNAEDCVGRWADTTATVYVAALTGSVGCITTDTTVLAYFTYVIDDQKAENNLTATPVGGSALTGTVTAGGDLIMSIPVGSTTYEFNIMHTVTYVMSDGSEAPVTKKVVHGVNHFIDCPFDKDGWTLYRWKIGDEYYQSTDTFNVDHDVEVTAVLQKRYNNADSNSGGYMIVRDNGLLNFVDYQVYSNLEYTIDNNIISFDLTFGSYTYTYLFKLVDSNGTYIEYDYMDTVSFVATDSADNEHTLTFDGYGTATLGPNTLPYQYFSDYDEGEVGVYLTIDGNRLKFVFDYDEEYVTFDYKITVGGTDYVFGNPASCTVTYNKPDGATGDDMESVSAQAGMFTLADCAYTKEGYTFLGWKDESLGFSADPVVTPAGTAIVISGNTSYVAVFAQTYVNKYDDSVNIDFRDDDYVLIDLDGEPVYAQWERISDNMARVTVGNFYTAYAIFEGNTCAIVDEMLSYSFLTKDGNTTLTFDGNGHALLGQHEGTYSIITSHGYTIGVNLTFDSVEYECIFDFDSDYNPYICATIEVGEAQYVFDPYTAWYTVSYELGKDVLSGAPKSPVQLHSGIGNAEVTIDLPSNVIQSEDEEYYVAGWAVKNSDGTHGSVISSTSYTITEDTTFVAVWVKSMCEITYAPGAVGDDAVTGFNATSTGHYNPNSEVYYVTLLAKTAVTRQGYTLKHWVIQGDDSGKTYAPGQAYVVVSGDTTFEAVWEADAPTPSGELHLSDLKDTQWTGNVEYQGNDYDRISFDGKTLKMYEAGYDVADDFLLTEKTEDGKLVAEHSNNSEVAPLKITLTFTDAYSFNISIYKKSGFTEKTTTGTFTRPSAPEGSDKISYYIGEESTGSNPMTYGYSSANASDNVLVINDTTYYKLEIYYLMGNVAAKPYGAGSQGLVKYNDTTANKTTNDFSVLENAVFTCKSSGITFNFSFSIVDGKRAVTISYGTDSVTWTEITA